MKNTIKLAIGITVVMLCSSNFSFSQFIMNGIPPDKWANTTNTPAPFNVEAVGIGTFTTSPLSAFHVNTNLLTTTPIFTPGEVFRTDCPSGFDTHWRMLRGGTPFGRLFNLTGSNDFQIESPSGNLLLNATAPGFVGIGTSLPPFHLTIDNDGGILAMGTFGSGVFVPSTLTNPRMIWYPRRAAFRAGDATGGEWDNGNIGDYSTAFGSNTTASGVYSFAGGNLTNATGIGSVAFGENTNATNNWACAFGTTTIASGEGSFAIGRQNATASGNGSFAGGFDVFATNTGDFVFGENALSTGGFGVTFGKGIDNNGLCSQAFGLHLNTPVTTNNSFVFGNGFDNSNRLSNGIPFSFMIGFNSTIPTFFVEPPVTPAILAVGEVGICTTTPGNTLEINSPFAFNTANGCTGTGFSGLRFTDLTSASTPCTPNNLSLSVDVNGDVILVPGGGGVGTCTTPTVLAAPGGAIQFNNQNFYFDGNGSGVTTDNSLLVGFPCSTVPQGKIDVLQSSGLTNGSIGIMVENKDQQITFGGPPVIGIKSLVSNTGLNCPKIAGWFETTPAPNCLGSTNQYAIVVPKAGGHVSIGYTPPSTVFSCLVDVGGTVCVGGIALTSDASLKTNVNTLTNSLDKIRSLRGVSFEWIPSEVGDTVMSGTHLGLIAQEVDSVIPEIVHTDEHGMKTLAYTEIIPVLVEAIKEQQTQINSLMNQNQNNKTFGSNNSANKFDIKLALPDVPVLGEAQPNPNSGSVEIPYYLPENITGARVVFIDMLGRIMKEQILQPGYGTMNIDTQDLPSGTYSFSMIVDGKVVDSKKMIRTK